jgi:hypothetical protein
MAAIIVAGAVMGRSGTHNGCRFTRVLVCTVAGVTGIAVMTIAPACASDAFAGLDPLVVLV